MSKARQDPDRERLKSQLFRLRSWPNLTRLPQEAAVPVARICALLRQKHTAGFLVPKVLGMPSDEALVLLHALQALGHVEALQPRGTSRPDTVPAPPPVQEEAPRSLQGDSLLGKLWNRLTALH